MKKTPEEKREPRHKRRAQKRLDEKECEAHRDQLHMAQIVRERFGNKTLKRNPHGANVRPEFRRHENVL